MPHYLVQLAYTPEAWANQLKSPQNRIEAVRPAMEKVGARMESAYFAFGEYDIVFVMEAPDNKSAAAFALAVAAGGSVKAYKTTPLMTIEDGLQALRAASDVASAYRPPAG